MINHHVAMCPIKPRGFDMNPSINPNDFIHHNNSHRMTTPKQDLPSQQDEQKDTLTVKDVDKEQGRGWLTFIKKHRKFLLLQGILITMIVVSFIFW